MSRLCWIFIDFEELADFVLHLVSCQRHFLAHERANIVQESDHRVQPGSLCVMHWHHRCFTLVRERIPDWNSHMSIQVHSQKGLVTQECS